VEEETVTVGSVVAGSAAMGWVAGWVGGAAVMATVAGSVDSEATAEGKGSNLPGKSKCILAASC
jgi:hypothetical protein